MNKILLLILMVCCSNIVNGQENLQSPNIEKMLIVIAAPSVHDDYYRPYFEKLIDFDIQFAKTIMGKDEIVVLVDKDTLPYFKHKLPDDILLEADIADIWIRDFSTVHPNKMVNFNYDRPQQTDVQARFLDFIAENKLQIERSNIKLDGGNIVDNAGDKMILTEKVLDRNPNLSYQQIMRKLKQLLDVTEIAMIPMDEAYLGHADGMLMFIDEKTLLMNDYAQDKAFKHSVLDELHAQLTNVDIHEIEGIGYGESHGNYASACGIYVNSIVTNHYIYMPTFDNSQKDKAALQKIQSLTDKTVIPIDAKEVCFLGGNLRCLSWQLTGDNAQK
ncbi:MAG: agmatine deiminase family protein, partial [Thiotrichaceae bacterium]|nr:agmatine deiminase family protein [Thiotrichaceae bacterium]